MFFFQQTNKKINQYKKNKDSKYVEILHIYSMKDNKTNMKDIFFKVGSPQPSKYC
jgi:hypothetical protein